MVLLRGKLRWRVLIAADLGLCGRRQPTVHILRLACGTRRQLRRRGWRADGPGLVSLPSAITDFGSWFRREWRRPRHRRRRISPEASRALDLCPMPRYIEGGACQVGGDGSALAEGAQTTVVVAYLFQHGGEQSLGVWLRASLPLRWLSSRLPYQPDGLWRVSCPALCRGELGKRRRLRARFLRPARKRSPCEHRTLIRRQESCRASLRLSGLSTSWKPLAWTINPPYCPMGRKEVSLRACRICEARSIPCKRWRRAPPVVSRRRSPVPSSAV